MAQRPSLTTILRRLQDHTDDHYRRGDRASYAESRELERLLSRYLDALQTTVGAVERIGLTEYTLDRLSELRAYDGALVEIIAAAGERSYAKT